MKAILLPLLLFLYAPASVAPKRFEGVLTLKPSDCRATKEIHAGNCKVFLYRLPDGDLLKTQNLDISHPEASFSLHFGNYKIKYINNWGQTLTRVVTLDTVKKTVRICTDSLTSYPLNTLEKLKDNQQLVIFFHRSGCFVDEKKKLSIARRGAGWFATLSYTQGSLDANGRIRYEQVVRPAKPLSAEDIRQYCRFENELNHVGGGLCTTNDYYTVSSPYGTFSKTDGSCQWQGFDYLIAAWF